ncbi:30S ribosomal protein S4 [Candidatus Parvarchaeota archaeon]|nr:30S ribosomal protein S4 [Candidatus Parvarchaeota archaeon]
MGTSKRQSKKYNSPLRIWDKPLIKRDIELKRKYGFKNKKELWKVESELRSIRKRARDLVGLKAINVKHGEEEFIKKLNSMGLVKSDANVDNVLDLKLEDLLQRRLQTIVLKKGMAASIREARQLITHRHITVGRKIIDAPSYLVKKDEEELVDFSPGSAVSSSEHPIRSRMKKTV